VVAVVRADDQVSEWLGRDLRDFVEHPTRFSETSLAVGHQDTRGCHHEQADRRELLGAGGPKLLV
jgi:hypothetical protein